MCTDNCKLFVGRRVISVTFSNVQTYKKISLSIPTRYLNHWFGVELPVLPNNGGKECCMETLTVVFQIEIVYSCLKWHVNVYLSVSYTEFGIAVGAMTINKLETGSDFDAKYWVHIYKN